MKQLGTGQITKRGPRGGRSGVCFSSYSVFITVGTLGVQPGCLSVPVWTHAHQQRVMKTD